MESFQYVHTIEETFVIAKELYFPPQLNIIEVKVEKGFAASPVGDGGSGTGDWGGGTW